MKTRQFVCDRCGGRFTQEGMGRPRRYCNGCKGTLPKPVDLGPPVITVRIGAEVIPGRIERTAPISSTQEKFDLAVGVVRHVAAGRPCHQEAIEVLRRIEG